MSLHVCFGPSHGTTGRYRCACCGVEGNNIEAFAPGGACWMCAFGGNLDCPNCVEMGAAFNRHSHTGHRQKLHRFRCWSDDGAQAVASCGFRVARDDVGQATAVLDDCSRCWPEATDG